MSYEGLPLAAVTVTPFPRYASPQQILDEPREIVINTNIKDLEMKKKNYQNDRIYINYARNYFYFIDLEKL